MSETTILTSSFIPWLIVYFISCMIAYIFHILHSARISLIKSLEIIIIISLIIFLVRLKTEIQCKKEYATFKNDTKFLLKEGFINVKDSNGNVV